jgi:hypothetical protein
MLVRMQAVRRNLHILLVGMQISAFNTEIIMEVSQKTKNRTII